MERDLHTQMLALLPWYARGQLQADEMQAVREHLQACPQCEAELQLEQRLQALQQGPAPAAGRSDVEAGLARMNARLDEETEAPRRQAAKPHRPRWLPWLMGLQGVAIAGLLLVVARPQDGQVPLYRALSSSAPAATASPGTQVLIMFRPDAREQQIREALQASGATLIGGPTESQAYLLRLPREKSPQALARLRALPIVTLVESLEAAGPRP